MADFETTTDPDDCRVWNWFYVPLGSENVDWGKDIQSFFKYISKRDQKIYFHNLKFDGIFMLDALFRAGYIHTTDRKPKAMQFTTLIDKMGKFYKIAIMFSNGRIVEFFDSLKKLPFSVKNIAKAFKLPISKGVIDYHKPRPVGYEPTDDELFYGFNDVLIPAKALQAQFDKGLTKLTQGADALAEYKKVIGAQHFKNLFPVLDSEVDRQLRAAYRGGYTYANPRFQNKLQGSGKVYDVNSLYPSVMYNELLPYGEPVWSDGLPKTTTSYPLSIFSMTFTAKLKPGHLPIIQIKGMSMFSPTEYVDEIDEPVTLSFTNVDFALIQKHYDLEIESFNGGYLFHGATGSFREYIDKWSEVKKNSEGAMREIAKLMLNSLYGKFATNPDVTGKIPYFDPDQNRVRFKMGMDEERDPVYTAMGAFITSYARRIMITAAQANFDVFAYCDTDSMHLITLDPPVNTWVDPKELGAWKCEGEFSNAFYMRAKAYVEYMVADGNGNHIFDEYDEDGDNPAWSVHIAGVPREVARTIRFEDLISGRKLEGKMQPKVVPGGVVLQEIDFTLKF